MWVITVSTLTKHRDRPGLDAAATSNNIFISIETIVLVKSESVHLKSVGLGGSVGCVSDWRPGGHGFDPCRGWQHSFMEINHEIFLWSFSHFH